ncbi:response regulator [Sphingobacterium lactis]|uniref:response regulator transcription factor n=1 Tax=Sphingobacterium lactis TaxID=797291 RepID=UPI003F7E56D7
MIRTVICDDHPLITQGLTSYLASHESIEIIATASSSKELVSLLDVVQPDVLLLDIQLPDGSGLDLCGQIKLQYPNIHILGLSNLDDRQIILQMLSQGASGYVLKSAPLEEIEQAILHIASAGVYLGTGAQKTLANTCITPQDEIPQITRREKEVLNYLSKGLSSVQIAELMFVSHLTVDVHRRNLLQKFKVNKTVNLLQKVKDLNLLD